MVLKDEINMLKLLLHLTSPNSIVSVHLNDI